MSLAEIAAATGGTVSDGDDGIRVSGPATIDSRAVAFGGLFGAIPGVNVDGHDYAEAAVAAGAAAVLASRPVPVPHVLVPDVTVALGALAKHVAPRLTATVIGVTGSAGKTSVKDLIAAILEEAGPTVAPVGSQNNELGVPLTVLKSDASTRFLVVEMGARGIGHVADLCRMVPPAVGVVLNVGSAHIGEFGDVETIARAKGELVEALPADGVAVLSADDSRVSAMATRTTAPVLTFGAGGNVRLVETVPGPEGATVSLEHHGERWDVSTRLIGSHVGLNVAAAVAAASAVGVPVGDAMQSLAGIGARSPHRMAPHVRADGAVILDDTFNANPDAMAAALRTLSELQPDNRIAVLGEMLEMGERTADLHEQVGRLAADLGIEHVVAVGDGAAPIAVGAGAAGIAVADIPSAIGAVSAWLTEGSLVLVKASRGVHLERLVDALVSENGQAER